ncbi:MAG: hypothetical protein JWM68_1836 [Verrucomicrobiales bacterium]|nr:hypothetical protein [Verrucomicrobiales bacterium]
MARTAQERNLTPVIEAFQKWIDKCLVHDGSIFSNNLLWNAGLIEEVRSAFVDHPDESDNDFMTKLRGQMKNASAPAQQLMAEMTWSLLMFPSNIKPSTKQTQITEMWALSGEQFPDNSPMVSNEVLSGIGSAGPGFNNHRWREIAFLIALAGDLKKKTASERQDILSNYDVLVDWIDKVRAGEDRQFRHMLRFFAFPDRVERMASNRERRAVLEGFNVAPQKQTKKWTDSQLDKALFELRSKLEEDYPGVVLDFYNEPLREKWQHEADAVGELPLESKSYFRAEDCEVFQRYQASSWKEVSNEDKGRFKSIWTRLKSLSESFATESPISVGLKAETSHYVPNGRSPKEIWCCVYPESVLNKSYALQVALIIYEKGAELCFCLGSGTSQIGDPVKKQELAALFEQAKAKLKDLPPTLVADVLGRMKRKWFYRRSWLKEFNQVEFDSFEQWLQFAGSPGGNSAGISIYFTPPELEKSGQDINVLFKETYETFRPIFEFVYNPIQVQMNADPLKREHLDEFKQTIQNCGFRVEDKQLDRFVFSLVAKPFVILTGNSGTGKTKLAQLFAHWMTGKEDETQNGYTVVPVGADWTDNRNILGFCNHLRQESGKPLYQTTAVLELILRAGADQRHPYFLILDEMNLSHVERYFADLLSAMESGKPMPVHSEQSTLKTAKGFNVERCISFPDNLFVIGTVNVDETTYMFSSKVLDRANVIEFRVSSDDVVQFLATSETGIKQINPATDAYAEAFLSLSRKARQSPKPDLALAHKTNLSKEIPDKFKRCQIVLQDIFAILHKCRQEFGFRTMAEVLRYVHVDFELATNRAEWLPEPCMDAQILQKVLPKIHGSRKKIEPLLVALGKYSMNGDRASALETFSSIAKSSDFPPKEPPKAVFPDSYRKTVEMLETLRRDQFVSFIQ